MNQHLDVDMSNDDRLTMRYLVRDGFIEEKHYGLQLARIVNLPPQVLEVAEQVSRTLETQAAAKKSSSKSTAVIKRRKLILLLKEQLEIARDGQSERGPLLSWLRTLQEEFVIRMEQIENDCASSDSDDGDADESPLVDEEGSRAGTITAASEA